MENKDFFNYTYSAKEQEEIKNIRKKYLPTEEKQDKIQKLRRMDSAVTQKAQAFSLVFGVVGALILGFGMSLTMSDFGNILGLYEKSAMLIGILTGIIGITLVCLAYPVYSQILKKEREKIAPEIIRLSDELMR